MVKSVETTPELLLKQGVFGSLVQKRVFFLHSTVILRVEHNSSNMSDWRARIDSLVRETQSSLSSMHAGANPKTHLSTLPSRREEESEPAFWGAAREQHPLPAASRLMTTEHLSKPQSASMSVILDRFADYEAVRVLSTLLRLTLTSHHQGGQKIDG